MFFILGADGKEYGPVSVAKVQEWMIAGRANLQTQVRRYNETTWQTLGEMPEFADVSPASVPAPAAALVVPAAAIVASEPAAAPARNDLVLADRGSRLAAALLDSLIGLVLIGPGFGLLAAAGVFNEPNPEPNMPLLLAGICALSLGALALAIIQIYLLVTRGQTLGKKVIGVKIVTFDTGRNPGFVKTVLLRGFVNGLIGGIPVIGGIYAIVDVCFIFRDDRRCIHDLIAGTVVVKA